MKVRELMSLVLVLVLTERVEGSFSAVEGRAPLRGVPRGSVCLGVVRISRVAVGGHLRLLREVHVEQLWEAMRTAQELADLVAPARSQNEAEERRRRTHRARLELGVVLRAHEVWVVCKREQDILLHFTEDCQMGTFRNTWHTGARLSLGIISGFTRVWSMSICMRLNSYSAVRGSPFACARCPDPQSACPTPPADRCTRGSLRTDAGGALRRQSLPDRRALPCRADLRARSIIHYKRVMNLMLDIILP